MNYNIGQQVYMVSNYGDTNPVYGSIVGIERDDNDRPLSLLIQPDFDRSVYLDLRDEGFSVIPALVEKKVYLN